MTKTTNCYAAALGDYFEERQKHAKIELFNELNTQKHHIAAARYYKGSQKSLVGFTDGSILIIEQPSIGNILSLDALEFRAVTDVLEKLHPFNDGLFTTKPW